MNSTAFERRENMKKLFKSVIAVSIAASCMLSLTSCGFMDFMNKLEKTKKPESSSSVLDSSDNGSSDTEGSSKSSSSDDSSSYTDNSSSSGSYSDSSSSSLSSSSGSKESSSSSGSDILSEKLYKSVDELFGSASMKSMLEKTEETINKSSDQFTLDITVEKDAIIYDYKFKEQIPAESLDISREVAEESFEDSATLDKIKPLMKLMVQYVGQDNPKVVMKYTNADGSLIFEKTFDKSLLDE